MFSHWKELTPTVDRALFDDRSLMIETREIWLELAKVTTNTINTNFKLHSMWKLLGAHSTSQSRAL